MPPAAKQGDKIVAMDIHIVIIAGVPSPVVLPFNGIINGGLSTNVTVQGMAAATVNSTATNTPPHIPPSPFQKPPSNQGQIIKGSATVTINGKAAARAGDTALTCNDPVDAPVGTVVAASTVLIGG
jgi:uncharacterized Zn-binding protein involved in type VI secretion